MGYAVELGGFVARSGFNEEAQGDGIRIGVFLGDDVEAVGKLMVMESEWHRCAIIGERRRDDRGWLGLIWLRSAAAGAKSGFLRRQGV